MLGKTETISTARKRILKLVKLESSKLPNVVKYGKYSEDCNICITCGQGNWAKLARGWQAFSQPNFAILLAMLTEFVLIA